MSSKMLYRLSGGALLVGSPLFVLFLVFFSLLFGTPYDVSDPQKLMSSLWLFVNVVLLVATLLAAIGLPGVYARQAARMGWLGFFGFGLLFVAVLMMGVFNQLFAVFVLPWLATTVPNTTVSIAADKPPLLALFLISGVMLLVGAIASLGLDDLLDDFVKAHQRPLHMQICCRLRYLVWLLRLCSLF